MNVVFLTIVTVKKSLNATGLQVKRALSGLTF